MNVQVENIKLPKPKGKNILEAARRKVFRRYADAREKLYIVRPTDYTVEDMGTQGVFMTIKADKRICERASVTRIKQLTRMMENRLLDRCLN